MSTDKPIATANHALGASRHSKVAVANAWFPGLDGLRGVAVGLVFTVHYYGKIPIGWMGVIIFFVLSGFLITGGLYDTQDEPNRFRNFYIRRTLRIFPLFYFVWLCIGLSSFFLHAQWHASLLLWPLYLGNFARFVAGTTVVDHIQTRVQWLPIEIGHFWSLAVEEQFYLLWPLVVFKIRDRRKLMQICLWVMISVLLLRILLVWLLPTSMVEGEFTYRMTFTQADAFLCGGLLALWLRGPEKDRVIKAGPYVFTVALIVLALACFLNDPGPLCSKIIPGTPWMAAYGFTLVYLTAAGLLLSALKKGTLSRILCAAPLRKLGQYSYGFYVYHVLLRPILIRPWQNSPSHLAFRISIIVDFLAVFFVSMASYHMLEKPFLKLKRRVAVFAQAEPSNKKQPSPAISGK